MSPRLGSAVRPTKSLKIGFIGTGFIGQHQIKLLKKVAGAEIIGAADIKEAGATPRRNWALRKRSIPIRKCSRRFPEIQAVSVCTPNGLHVEHTVAALDAGKDVMVEKPMAMNAKQGQKMLDAARRNKKKLIVGFQHRFEPRSKLIRDRIAAGEFGKILYVRARRCAAAEFPPGVSLDRRNCRGAVR